MGTIEKFSFGEDFDAPEPVLPEVEEDPDFKEEIIPEPTFSEAELEAARSQARTEGHAQGMKEVRESIEQHVADTLDRIREQLAHLGHTISTALIERERDAAALSATIARKIVPEVAQYGAVDALTAFVSECMEKVRDEPRLVIHVNEAVADPLRTRMGDIAQEAGYPGDVAVLSDEELPVTDCHIEWMGGGTDYRASRVWGEIDSLMQSFLDNLAHPGKAAAEPAEGDQDGPHELTGAREEAPEQDLS